MGNGRDKPEISRRRNRSINAISIEQIIIACRHVDEMLDVGVTENLAIRTLELFTDVYAKVHFGGSVTPHSADQVGLWSIEALKARTKNPNEKLGQIVRVEHGTPKRALARLCLELFRQDQLNEDKMRALVDRHWKLAVITLEEDKRLNKTSRSTAHSSPEKRWSSAGIKFP